MKKNRCTILYIDDESINLELFELLFNKEFNILTAESGDQALEIIKNTPKLKAVISDMRLPNITGLEIIKKARQLKSELSYFILSGYEITEELNNALSDKILDDYFQKPMNKKQIFDALTNACL